MKKPRKRGLESRQMRIGVVKLTIIITIYWVLTICRGLYMGCLIESPFRKVIESQGPEKGSGAQEPEYKRADFN